MDLLSKSIGKSHCPLIHRKEKKTSHKTGGLVWPNWRMRHGLEPQYQHLGTKAMRPWNWPWSSSSSAMQAKPLFTSATKSNCCCCWLLSNRFFFLQNVRILWFFLSLIWKILCDSILLESYIGTFTLHLHLNLRNYIIEE